MGVNAVVDRYSSAIFELAQEQSALESIETDFLYVRQVLKAHPDLMALLMYPQLEGKKKAAVLEKIFKGDVQPLSLNFLCVMIVRGRARFLDDTLKEYIKRSRQARGIEEARITVASPLSKELEDRLRAKLQSVTGKAYELEIVEDPSIIGGIIIQTGDTRIDGSLSRRLKDLEEHLQRTEDSRIEVK